MSLSEADGKRGIYLHPSAPMVEVMLDGLLCVPVLASVHIVTCLEVVDLNAVWVREGS
jgi:hypothetical protein